MQQAAQRDTVDVGQPQVEQDEVGVRGVERGRSRRDAGGLAAGADKPAGQLRTDGGVVLDD